MKTTQANHINLIAACGLYCRNCGKYKKNKCPGCMGNTKATWCKIRSCCIENNIANCSACINYTNPMDCSKYNNLFGRVIEFFTHTDRSLCIRYLQEKGEDDFATMMTEKNRMSLPKNKNK